MHYFYHAINSDPVLDVYLKDSIHFFDHKHQDHTYETADNCDALHDNAGRQVGHGYAHHFHYEVFVNRTGHSVNLR